MSDGKDAKNALSQLRAIRMDESGAREAHDTVRSYIESLEEDTAALRARIEELENAVEDCDELFVSTGMGPGQPDEHPVAVSARRALESDHGEPDG